MSREHCSEHLSCPTPAELAAFLSAELPPHTMDQIGAHVTDCPNCEAAVQKMDEVTSVTFRSRRRAEGAGGARCAAVPTSPVPPPRLPVPHLPLPAVPAQLGPYRLGEPLGRGGMGTVYRGEHVRLKKAVAVKVLDTALVRDSRAVARFQREMEVVGRIDHPNVVRATDAGEVDGFHFLVMELIDGKTFAGLITARGPLPVAEACELTRQAALALQGAHEHGLVHRDIKPSNLMLSATGQVKLLDLGLARLRFGGADELTRAGEVMGTAEYMAPEQWAETNTVDIRSDLYALGCTLFALLTGEPPYPGSGPGSFLRLMCAHKQNPVPAIADRRADVPPALNDLLTRLLAKDPADRPPTPAAVAAELAPLARGADLARLPVPGLKNVPSTQPSLRPVAPKYGRLIVAATVLAAGLAGASTYALRAGVGGAARDQGPGGDEPRDPKRWHNLLATRPGERFWFPTDVNQFTHNADKEVLTVQSTRPALLRLGNTNAQGYKLQIGFRQVRWTGGFGVYFGGQTNAPNEFVCQIIDLRHLKQGSNGEYGLTRVRAQIALNDRIAGYSANGIGTGYIAPPGNEELILELEVKPEGLGLVRWNGIPRPELVNARALERSLQLFPKDPHTTGEFGVYCNGSTVTVSTARYLFIE
ncbi:MAG TPA: serine/threonine-protein kinase [Gemmata sp.]